MTHAMSGVGFLAPPEPDADARRVFDEDIAELGFVMNASRLWAYRPTALTGLFDLLRETASAQGLTLRQRGVLVSACASTLGDAGCSLAWGARLAQESDPETAAGVLRGDDAGLTPGEQALAGWARQVVRDPTGTTAADVQVLRDAGYDDALIFSVTVFVALRLAFSTVNNALGSCPDAGLRALAPQAVLDAVTYGRPVDEAVPLSPPAAATAGA
jgi:alkylhydroperoxidase family enzyme